MFLGATTTAQVVPDLKPGDHKASAAYKWLDIVLEASARDVERVGAMPTILSRQMAKEWVRRDSDAALAWANGLPESQKAGAFAGGKSHV